MQTVSARVADALSPHVTDVFGVMGNGNAYFIDALVPTPMAFTAVRHEAGAVAAADAYTRASGRIAVATATYGAGFTNTITALAEATQAGTPMIVVVGSTPTTGARPWDVDQSVIATAVGVETFVVAADDAARVTIDALHHAIAHRRPAVIAIPYDLSANESTEQGDVPALAAAFATEVDTEAVTAAAHSLAAARRPLVIAGRGAIDAAIELNTLAGRLDALTGTTALARGIFADPVHDLGIMGGFGQANALELAQQADVVLVVGASMNQFTMRFGMLLDPAATVIQLDDRSGARSARADQFVLGDARSVLQHLVTRLPTATELDPDWPRRAAALDRGHDRGDELAADGRLDPRALAGRLGDLLPEDRVVVTDGGHFLGWSNTHWAVSEPRRMQMVGTAYQTIGLGLPSAVGAGRARPESTIVLCTGDGGGLMALADLESVVRTVRRGIVVVWNDAAYNAEVTMYGSRGLDETAMRIPQVDFAGLARALGARASTVEKLDDLVDLERWIDSGVEGVFLVDCRISPTVIAPYQVEIMGVNSRH